MNSAAGAPQVDFYILPDVDPAQRALFACRLIEKVYRLRHSVYVHCGDRQQAGQLDALLWRQPAAGFMPHELHTETTAAPIQLGWDGIAPAGSYTGAVLINLADAVPAFFERFARVSEIVVQVPEILAATRTAWRYYQQCGCILERHDLRPGQR